MNMPIIESGMSFGPFIDGHCFYIEKSVTYKKIEKMYRWRNSYCYAIKRANRQQCG